jgi:FAD dependent oxidoreductase
MSDFNVTNTPHFGNPSANVSSGGCMTITSASSSSNNAEGGERVFRFAVRILFQGVNIMRISRRTLIAATAVLLLFASLAPATAATYSHDIVIYGATSGGVAAAIAASRSGANVGLVEPGRHVGGMLTGGLGRTDMDRQEQAIGGIAREFFERTGRHYGRPIAWTFEPSVAERILMDWLRESGVKVYFGQRLAPEAALNRDGDHIVSFRTEQGSTFRGRVFIDSSYEGDLMKAAGVDYRVGREDRTLYNESLAGRQDFLPGRHQFRVPVSPYGDDGNLLPHIVSQEKVGQVGAGDGKFQAYCFRLCFTSDPKNKLPFPKPKDYRPERFTLVRNYIRALGDEARLNDFLGISPMPNSKTDINASVVSTNLPGANWDYPDGSYRRRQEIWDEHLSWAQGLVYFLANDESVPQRIRDEMNRWGLAKDEFIDTDHWPHQLYVREARRMLGEYVLTQHDLETRRRKYDSIGMAGYNIDIREVQWVARRIYRFPNVNYELLMEGYVSMPVEPWEIPYRALLPRQQQAANLLVSACISASQVAYASFRMEPQHMIAGQAAGTAAAIAVKNGVAVHHVSIPELQRALRQQNQVLSLTKNQASQ